MGEATKRSKDDRPELTVHVYCRTEPAGLKGLVRVEGNLKTLKGLSRDAYHALDRLHILKDERNHFIIMASIHHPTDADYHPDGKSVAMILDLLHRALEPHFRLNVTYDDKLQATVREVRAIYP